TDAVSSAGWGSAAVDAERVAAATRLIQQYGASRVPHLAALYPEAAGGGGGGGAGSFFQLGGGAGRTADKVINFARTWLPRLHYTMTATNEILATIGPAAVAAGAAALVGLQGGQQLV